MKLIQVTDDQGCRQFLNPAHILGVKERPKTALGSVIKHGNGTSLAVIEGVESVLAQLRGAVDSNNEVLG
jgi:uncharacterized protein YlzI (FlbEa/FlbD family)